MAGEGFDFLFGKLDGSLRGAEGHKDAEDGIGGGGDRQGGKGLVGVGLEGDDVIGIALHAGEPICNKCNEIGRIYWHLYLDNNTALEEDNY